MSRPDPVDTVASIPPSHVERSGEATSNDAPLELLRLKTAEAAALQVHIIATATLYFTGMGAIFKFSFDASSSLRLRTVLSIVGIATSLVVCAAAIFCHWYRKRLLVTLRLLRQALGLQRFTEELPGIKYSIILALLGALVVICAWVFVLRLPRDY